MRPQSSGLERKLLVYLGLVATAALMIGVEFVVDMSRADLRDALWSNVAAAIEARQRPGETERRPSEHGREAEFDIESVFEPLSNFRTKIVTMLLVQTIVVAIVFVMFIRNITTPLQRLAEGADRINQGDLRHVIHVDANDEIGRLGVAINGLTSNLQELAAFSTHASQSMVQAVDKLLEEARVGDPGRVSQRRELTERVNELRSIAMSLNEFVAEFELLETARVAADGGKRASDAE